MIDLMGDNLANEAVYHVATLDHWREVVAEQLRTLLGNVDIANFFVTIGAESSRGEVALVPEHIHRPSGCVGSDVA